VFYTLKKKIFRLRKNAKKQEMTFNVTFLDFWHVYREFLKNRYG
jgi:hypothetical protein